MKIGIMGYGVVGMAINHTMSNEFEVIKYDKFNNYDSFSSILSTSAVFISVYISKPVNRST